MRLPISVTVAIGFKYNALVKPGHLAEEVSYRNPLIHNHFYPCLSLVG